MSSGLAIEAFDLSKRYTLGGIKDRSYRTLRDAIAVPLRSGPGIVPNHLWALKDVSFSVREGEALGVIGRNGAGKSTLLKILSRITEPTSGKARLRGRVASLLEVGTGFHPELTGRENVYLNGAILGMTRAEINRDFDAIVAFAEVERFLDTPVKRYSSGMYVRLAFAVAAHLTPEILLVDEVLAVGDVEFQRRCLGRMSEVARSGRTVLFVSHNLASIESLCPRSLLFRGGTLARQGPSQEIIADYLSARGGPSLWDLRDSDDREGNGRARIERLELLEEDGKTPLEIVAFGTSFRVRIHFRAMDRVSHPIFGLALLTERDERVFFSSTADTGQSMPDIQGEGFIDCVVRDPNVLPSTYRLEVWIIDIPNVSFTDHVRMVGKVEVVVGEYRLINVSQLSERGRGHVYVRCDWLPT